MDVVLNLDIPTHSKDYIHRVGRTARAGRSGKAITFVSQYANLLQYCITVHVLVRPKKINNMFLRHFFLENDAGGRLFIFIFFE